MSTNDSKDTKVTPTATATAVSTDNNKTTTSLSPAAAVGCKEEIEKLKSQIIEQQHQIDAKMTPQQWLEKKMPGCIALNENDTFERDDFPEYVRQWIRENWIKVNDKDGGTWEEPQYHRSKEDWFKAASAIYAASYGHRGDH